MNTLKSCIVDFPGVYCGARRHWLWTCILFTSEDPVGAHAFYHSTIKICPFLVELDELKPGGTATNTLSFLKLHCLLLLSETFPFSLHRASPPGIGVHSERRVSVCKHFNISGWKLPSTSMAIGSKVNNPFVPRVSWSIMSKFTYVWWLHMRRPGDCVNFKHIYTIVIVLSQQYTELKQILVSENGGVEIK